MRKYALAMLAIVVGLPGLPGVQAQERAKESEVTAKEIETFGKELVDKRRELVCKFEEVNDSWVKLLLKDESVVGIFVHDSKGDLFQYAFASKEKYGRDLLKMKRGDSLRLIGRVKEVKSKYVFMVEMLVVQAPMGRNGENPKDSEVTAKEIETFGKGLVDKRRELVCKFEEVNNSWVTLLLKDESFVGIFVHDSKGDLFQYAFASKEKYGRDLLKMKRGDSLRLIGKVIEVKSKYVFMVEEINK